MNDPRLAIEKLKKLLDSALVAESDMDRANIYSAARWLIADLDRGNEEHLHRMGEHITRAGWAFGAILGFDVTNGHPAETHWGWGVQALKVLDEFFAGREE